MFYFCVLSCWWKSRMACHCLLCRSTWGRTSFILETAASGDHWSWRCCDISQQPTSVALLLGAQYNIQVEDEKMFISVDKSIMP